MWRRSFVSLLLVACVTEEAPVDYGDPTSLSHPTTVDGITAAVLTPRSTDAATITIDVDASSSDDDLVASLASAEIVRVMPATADGFALEVGLAQGENAFEVRLATADGAHYRRIPFVVTSSASGVRIERVRAETCAGAVVGSVVRVAHVCVETSGEDREVDLDEGANTIDVGGDSMVITRDSYGPDLSIDPVAPSGAAEVTLHGTYDDDAGVVALTVSDPSGTVDDVPLGSPFDIPVSLQPGLNTVVVAATDGAGNRTEVTLDLRRARRFAFADPTPPGAVLTLALDRNALSELVLEDDQKELVLANVDLRPAMVNAFNAVKDPVKYGVDTSNWTQLQWNSNAILNITPDNIDVTGTLMEPLLRVSEAVGVAPARILAETFGIAPTDSILAGEQIVDALIDNVVGSHPNAQFDPETGRPIFVLTLYDVLRDLETLGERLGPVEGHPGLVGAGGTHGDLLEPGFAMNVTATSQFTRYDGVDASRDLKDFLFALPPDTPAVTFDFEDPATFTVVGMKDEPTIDFEFQITGILERIEPGTEQFANPAPSDKFGEGFYFGNSKAWEIPRYFDERVITESAFRIYHAQFAEKDYKYTHVYSAGNIDDVATVTWDRGWLDITTKGDLGDPPPPAYIWDFVLDVVQTRALDGGLEPFGGSTIFQMHDIPVGLDADQLIAQLRPTLQEQAVDMSDILVGREQIADSGADFFYHDGALWFRAASDSSVPYTYTKPGFFSDAALTTKVSTLDAGHEAWALSAGAIAYFADDQGAVFRIDVIDAHTLELLPVEAP